MPPAHDHHGKGKAGFWAGCIVCTCIFNNSYKNTSSFKENSQEFISCPIKIKYKQWQTEYSTVLSNNNEIFLHLVVIYELNAKMNV